MNDIFGIKEKIDIHNAICHSGGANGSDVYFRNMCIKYKCKGIKEYSYKTEYHDSPYKIELTEDEYLEGIDHVYKANKTLNRWGINKYMNLLSRNWYQVKNSHQIFAISTIIAPNKKSSKGYYNRSKYEVVDGGTGYAVQMGIDNKKPVFVFDQLKDAWYEWSYSLNKFKEIDGDNIYLFEENFTGIGTRNLIDNGKKAIEHIFINTVF